MTDDLRALVLPTGGPAIATLPKVSLHDHLDGGVNPATLIELADAVGHALPSDDPAALADWFRAAADSGSLERYLETFTHTLAVMQTREGIERVARDFVADLVADGVVYAEIRWAPEQHLAGGLGLDDAVAAVQAGLDAGVDAAASAGHRIRTGQLLCAMRQNDRALEIAELAVRHRERGVVGFDIAGPEAGFPAARHRAAFDYLAAAFFPTTVHAGEADGVESIRGALLDGRALRLGHGVRIMADVTIEGRDDEVTLVTLGPLAQWVKDREIALEIAPQSNLQTDAWGTDLADHPFDSLYQLGFAVTVNPDNRLMSATSITRELHELARTFGYGLDDVEVFQLNAAAATFLPIEEREELAETILRGFRPA
ncbi:adenosine deaminase [Galbitalea sp. SE-J8]|uniref:adenosine deaminase n=1 Tax=Galbitalea sp. SE-J8 TaxID=3054952 RepID=UPI00259C86E7|nr:adenosine deaminase [Galbitalea sp. SE-J8]MDM4762755.1 adenosine deaminase [Galbitalea sp. SE-J8]